MTENIPELDIARSESDMRQLADAHLPGDYTIQHTIFNDGDERWKATHSVGWELGTRYDYVLWGDGELWVEYYEGDSRRDRRIYRTQLQERMV